MKAIGQSALILGSTGAVGAQLVSLLCNSDQWEKIHLIVRKPLQEWKSFPNYNKLNIQVYQDLDNYFKKENKYNNVDTLFCCLGSQVKHGQQTFIKIDKTYPLLAADIAIKNNISHYIHVSSMGSNPNSWFLYPRTKGQVQKELALKNLNHLSIFKPGLLKNRRDARTIEKLINFIPFTPGIQATQAALSLKIIAQKYHNKLIEQKNNVIIYENKDMVNIVQNQNK